MPLNHMLEIKAADSAALCGVMRHILRYVKDEYDPPIMKEVGITAMILCAARAEAHAFQYNEEVAKLPSVKQKAFKALLTASEILLNLI